MLGSKVIPKIEHNVKSEIFVVVVAVVLWRIVLTTRRW